MDVLLAQSSVHGCDERMPLREEGYRCVDSGLVFSFFFL